jgi:hypothetical protein
MLWSGGLGHVHTPWQRSFYTKSSGAQMFCLHIWTNQLALGLEWTADGDGMTDGWIRSRLHICPCLTSSRLHGLAGSTKMDCCQQGKGKLNGIPAMLCWVMVTLSLRQGACEYSLLTPLAFSVN